MDGLGELLFYRCRLLNPCQVVCVGIVIRLVGMELIVYWVLSNSIHGSVG